MAEEGKDYPFARFNKVGMTALKNRESIFTVSRFQSSAPFQMYALIYSVLLSAVIDSADPSVLRAGISGASPRRWLD